MSSSKMLLLMATAVLLLVGAAVLLAAWFDSTYPITFAMIATGVIIFFGFLSLPESGITESRMRNAIAASLTISYLELVAYGAFLDPEVRMPELANTLVGSFTGVVGTVIVFYFGASAYLQANSVNPARPDSGSDQGEGGDAA